MRVWFLDLVTSGVELSFTEKGKTLEESVGREIKYSIWNILSLKYPNRDVKKAVG